MSADKRTFYGHSDGRGVLLHPDGGFEGGDYRNGAPNGWFVTMEPGGNVHVGDFVNGRKHGRGIHISPGAGVVMMGEYREGELIGEPEAFVVDGWQSSER